MPQLNFKLASVFQNGYKVEAILNQEGNINRNLILYSGAGTGKTYLCSKVMEQWNEFFPHGIIHFIPAEKKFGTNEAYLLSELSSYGTKGHLVVFDEGVKITPEAQSTILTLANQRDITFIICTNHLNKLSDILKDRFTLVPCAIRHNEDICVDLDEWMEVHKPDLYQKITEHYHIDFETAFRLNFRGTIRKFFDLIDLGQLRTKEINLNNLDPLTLTGEDIFHVMEACFDVWLNKSHDKKVLYEICNTIHMMNQSDYKVPFVTYLIKISQNL